MLAGLTPAPALQQRAFAINLQPRTPLSASARPSPRSSSEPTIRVLPGCSSLPTASLVCSSLSCSPALPSLHRPRGADETTGRLPLRPCQPRAPAVILARLLLVLHRPLHVRFRACRRLLQVAAHVSATSSRCRFTVNTAFIVAIAAARACGSSAGSGAATRWPLVGLIWAVSWALSRIGRSRRRPAGEPGHLRVHASPPCSDSAKPSWRLPCARSSTPGRRPGPRPG